MATKKKAKKKSTKPKKTIRKKTKPTKAAKRPKKLGKKKPALTVKATAKKTSAAKKRVLGKKPAPRKRDSLSSPVFLPKGLGSGSAGQSGDLQGLSRREAADSESVDELIEEGNAFEADAVMGVEDADNADEQEVHTHEVPEDDVPGEYLDEE
jgi:hypothetical protein